MCGFGLYSTESLLLLSWASVILDWWCLPDICLLLFYVLIKNMNSNANHLCSLLTYISFGLYSTFGIRLSFRINWKTNWRIFYFSDMPENEISDCRTWHLPVSPPGLEGNRQPRGALSCRGPSTGWERSTYDPIAPDVFPGLAVPVSPEIFFKMQKPGHWRPVRSYLTSWHAHWVIPVPIKVKEPWSWHGRTNINS
jgi:hypothetical protein